MLSLLQHKHAWHSYSKQQLLLQAGSPLKRLYCTHQAVLCSKQPAAARAHQQM
jgi:hypothetical protein